MDLKSYLLESTGNYSFTLNLQTLHSDIPDSVFNSLSEDDYVQMITNITHNQDDMWINYIKIAYNIWKEDYGCRKRYVPFRFNKNGQIKLSRTSGYDDERLGFGNNKKGITIDGIKITRGEGLGGSPRGYKFENDLLGGLKLYVSCGLVLDDIKKSVDIDTYKSIYLINKQPNLKNVFLKIYNDIKDKPEDVKTSILDECIIKSGTHDTSRGLQDEFTNKNINYNKVLNDSGKRISDITIKYSGQEVYISVKMKEHQNSAPYIAKQTGNTHDWVDKVFVGKSNESDLEKFKVFFEKLGIDPANLINTYKQIPNTQNQKLKTLDTNEIPGIIDLLMGRDYWFVSPVDCFYVPSRPKYTSFKIDEAYVYKTGRRIVVNGMMSGQRIRVILRTSDSKFKYPYRLYVEIPDIKAVIK